VVREGAAHAVEKSEKYEDAMKRPLPQGRLFEIM